MFKLLKINGNFSNDVVETLIMSIFEQLNVQSLPKSTRHEVIKLLHTFICNKTYIEGLMKKEDFAMNFLQNVAQETSPKNLILIFEMYCYVLAHLSNEDLMEEFFENITLYFPIDYDESSVAISRLELSQRILLCLYSIRGRAANLIIPFLVEKCLSDWGQGRTDSFEALGICISGELPSSLKKELPELSQMVIEHDKPMTKEVIMANKFSIIDTVCNSSEDLQFASLILASCVKALRKLNGSDHEMEDLLVSIFKIIWPLKDNFELVKNIDCLAGIVPVLGENLIQVYTRELKSRKVSEFIEQLFSNFNDAFDKLSDLKMYFDFIEKNEHQVSYLCQFANYIAQSDNLISLKPCLETLTLDKFSPKAMVCLQRVYNTRKCKEEDLGIANSTEILHLQFCMCLLRLQVLTSEASLDKEVWKPFLNLFTMTKVTLEPSFREAVAESLIKLLLSSSSLCSILVESITVDGIDEAFVVEILTKLLLVEGLSVERLSGLITSTLEAYNNLNKPEKTQVYLAHVEKQITKTILIENAESFMKNGHPLVDAITRELYNENLRVKDYLALTQEANCSIYKLSAVVFSKFPVDKCHKLMGNLGSSIPEKTLRLALVYGGQLEGFDGDFSKDFSLSNEEIASTSYEAYLEKVLASNDPSRLSQLSETQDDFRKISLIVYALQFSCPSDVMVNVRKLLLPSEQDNLQDLTRKTNLLIKYKKLLFPSVPRRVFHLEENQFYYQKMFEYLLRPLMNHGELLKHQSLLDSFLELASELATKNVKVLNDSEFLKVPIRVLKSKLASDKALCHSFHLIKLISETKTTKIPIDDLDFDDIVRQMIDQLTKKPSPKLLFEILSLMQNFVTLNTPIFIRYESRINKCLEPLLQAKHRLIRVKTASLMNHIFTCNY